VRFADLVQASSILITGCPDGELIAAEAQAAGSAVLPLHENLKLVGVPDNPHAANAHSALRDLISFIWDPVVPQHDFSPLGFERKMAEALRPPPATPLRPGLLD
jgi:hypothetical protein